MARKWGNKKEIVGGDKSATPHEDKPERITPTLDHVLVAESAPQPRLSAKKLIRNKRITAVIVVILVLAVAGLVVLFRDDPPPLAKPQSYVTAEGVSIQKLNDADLQTEVDKIIFQKKYNSARELIAFQDTANSRDKRLMIAAVYINQGDPNGAIGALKAVEQGFGEDWAVSRDIGHQYRILKNDQAALEYYQKALRLLKQADKEHIPLSNDEIYYLESDIKLLGGKP